MDDLDAPMGTWDHWIVWNINPVSSISEDSVPGDEGANGWGRTGYGGPCPPSGTHSYFFKLYALGQSESSKELKLRQSQFISRPSKKLSDEIRAQSGV